jgi:excinuclease ABC subunit C
LRWTAAGQLGGREIVTTAEDTGATPEHGERHAEAPGVQGKTAAPTGAQVIAAYLKTLTTGPGVYRMFDARGEVLYVGKARNLKSRVQSYTRPAGHTNRIARMIAAVAAMEFVTTATEADALLLEANFIKRFKPPFNVLMRDDKSFPHILIARDCEAPPLIKHRGARQRKGDYFGPFASPAAVNRAINTLQRAFLLRSCADSVYESRTRPCLLFQIKRCAAPCTGEISIEDYRRLADEACRFLNGKSDAVRKELTRRMEEASEALEYEHAADYRDRLAALSHVQAHQGVNPQYVAEADVFAACQEAGQTCIQVFFFRNHQNWGARAYFPRADKSFSVEEVLESFIAQFYDGKQSPRMILLSHELPGQAVLAEALSTRAGRKVTAGAPRRGEKRELVAHALLNAREALGRKLAETSTQARLLEGVGTAFGLTATPRRIEVYDNSHIQGANAVGAMIVAGPEGFEKKEYRKFNIRSAELTPGDDYAMMREVLGRRFARMLKEENAGLASKDETQAGAAPGESVAESQRWSCPDLLLIDGGAGQLSAACAVLGEMGLAERIPVVGVAKGPDRNAGRERFFIPGREPLSLPQGDPVLYFVQRLRDEAHRFAIGSHRARRKKNMALNPLDEVPGVGPTRKRALLKHFGSAKAVSRAGVSDLQAVAGISESMARAIYEFFHEKQA